MPLDPNTKTAEVRAAMAQQDWERAIRVAARFRSLGKHGEAIRRAKDALNNPALYAQLGHDLDAVVLEAIAALKDRFSLSWKAVQDSKESSSEEADT